jgi:hypothetical protein
MKIETIFFSALRSSPPWSGGDAGSCPDAQGAGTVEPGRCACLHGHGHMGFQKAAGARGPKEFAAATGEDPSDRRQSGVAGR